MGVAPTEDWNETLGGNYLFASDSASAKISHGMRLAWLQKGGSSLKGMRKRSKKYSWWFSFFDQNMVPPNFDTLDML